MDRLRPRHRQRQRAAFSGFTKPEIKKMEKFLMKSRELLLSKEFCKKMARNFSSSAGRAGKPIIKWTEEVLVRFVGFGADEDEWVNVKKAVRHRSIPFQHSECNKVMVGDLEKRDQLIYYDVHVNGVERKTHDIRGCRCIFLIRYDHDGSEASVVSHCILLLINNSIAGESSIEKTILYSRPRNLIVFMILLNLCSSPNHIFALSSEFIVVF
ncbi:Chloride channel E [Gossypium arboreum]|uniref:Chloride channel E n=1 Tax=Gossypium arboreum TaxID=29729 RepID=A0A0B0MUZ9_GOSAR|nr:Chloride channel E [Gossypium arboreum]